MKPERWQQIKGLLQSALERDPAERSAFVAAECAGDEALRQEVQSLIISHEQAGKFIESPAVEVMAGSLGDDQVVGNKLGPYAISALLGAGGMGEVYLAEDTRLGRKVALKMLPAYLTMEDERVRRFQQEARAASALNHPNIITIYEIGEMDSRHFMATEFIEGETLFDRLRAGLMKVSDALDVAVQVTSALCAAHQAGIVHRDIKPGNIMLRKDGIVKVLDFGLATLTEQESDDLEAATLVKTKPGIVMGTPHYMSPEQARGQKMDARTDIFSIGIVTYEMLTGRVPFAGQTMTDVLASILMLEPPSLSQSAPEVPDELHRIVHRTLLKDKDERYQTAGELLSDLKTLKQELEFETRQKAYFSPGAGVGAVTVNARPETRYARSGDVNIAYQVLGDGPIDLVYVPGWVTNIDYSWEDPSLARYYRRLASFSRLILFDKRGTGLSDQTAKLPTLEQRMDDVRAVMDAVGSERAALFGASEGGPMCVLFAATYPERTSALVTYGIFANRIWDPDYPWAPTPEDRQKWYDRIEHEWGSVIDLPTLAPSVANDPRFRQWWASFLRLSASPGAALALSRTNTEIDVRHILPAIRVATLVLHRKDDLEVNVEEGRFIAERIGGAKFVELSGRDHLPWVGDQNAILNEVEEFLRGIQEAPEMDRVLATVLFTHTMGPTAGAARLRPHQWRELLERFHQIVRKDLKQFRGHEIQLTENQLLATFDGPARAIRAASAMNDAALSLDIEIKAGLHTGECDVIGDKVGGVAVEIGAQVAAKAASSEVLVSSTVKDLVAGSGIEFEDRGSHALKGVAEKWRLFAVKQDSDSGSVTKALTALQTKAGRRSKAIDSLAVLPLFNVSSDPDTEYLSDGITDSIINNLSQLPKLRVMARSTVFHYKDREIDPREVGRDLKVRAVLTGRVQQLDDRIVISAELVDVNDGSQLWGEHYSRELSDIFGVQEEIAKEISEKLRLKLTPAERKRLTKRSTQSSEAYQLYLKGRFFWNKRTEEGLRQSIEYFQQAIEKDPGYAAAYAGLSDSYALLALRGLVTAKEAFPKARAAARKALEIDDELGEAYASLAHVRLHEWDWVGLEEEFQRALKLNPGHSIAYPWYAEYLMAIGKADESIAIATQAQEIDPLSPSIIANMAIAFYFARRFDQGIEQLRQGLKLSPNHFALHLRLGQAYLPKRKYEEAIQEMQKAATLSGRSTETLAGLGQAYAAAGLKEELQQVLEELNEQSKERYLSPYYVAKIYASLGDREQAFTWLEKAYQERNPDFIELKVEPLLDPIRSDARFQDLLRRVGLVPSPIELATSNPLGLSQSNSGASPGISGTLSKARRRLAKPKAIESLAVLPLVNDSADPNMEYFSDGITESIINALSQLPKLRVVARSTVFRYKGREIDPQEVGQELGVRAVLTGRVRQTGNGLMIAAELIDVTNDSQLWGEHYSRGLSDIFAVQEEIAKEISDKLRLKLTPAERKRLTKRATESTEAYQLYLKGRFFWNKRTEPGLRQSIEFFQEAIEKDPAYAAAYAGMSDCYTILAVRHGASTECLRRAKAAAMKALEIDETLAEAHTALAHARLHDWEWAEAEKGIERALELNPADATAHNFFGEYLLAVERIDEAIVEIKKAQELDPLSLITTSVAAWTFYFARQYDQAIEETRKTLELDPDFFWARYRRGQAYERKGMFDEAIAELQRARQLSQGNKEISAALAHAYAVSGRRKEAQDILDQLQEESARGSCSAYDLGIIHAGFGENDQAFQWLEKAYQEHDSKIIHLKVDPRLDALHSDPRFADLARRLGLPERQEFNSEPDTVTPGPSGSTRLSVPLEQEIRFCTTADGVRIAYATVGEGPPLLKAANWLNHLEFDWKSPIWRHVVEEFARDHLLVRYDERGNGLSDWNVEQYTFEAFVQDMESVVEAVGLQRFPILGISQGGPVAIAYAVRHPEKVSHLILCGAYARGWASRGLPSEAIERMLAQQTLIKFGWGQDNPAFRQLWTTLYIPDGTQEQWEWFNDLHRVSTSPDNAIRLLAELGKIDVTDLLPQVKVPTLVLHCRDEVVVPFEEGRLLAAKIPGARFVPLEGRNHLLLKSDPAWPKFVTEVRRFLETEQTEAKPEWSPQDSHPSDSVDRKTSGRYTTVGIPSDEAVRTGEIAPAPVTSSGGEITREPLTSSAEYVVGGIKRHKTAVAAIAAIVVLLIAGLVYSSFSRRTRTIDSLAVLPFLNVSGDPNTEYLSDGIAESIIYSTSQLAELRVTPRSSVLPYKGKEIDPQTVGRELGVSAIMTGRVIQHGDDLSISAELVDLRENRVVWGKQYNRKLGDILTVQEEIARESSEKLRLLTTEEKKQLSKRYPENAEAYQLYLKGRYYWNKRNADGYQKGIDHFQQAIEKDPNYALAWTGLADSYMLLGRFGVVPPKESMPKAKYAATKALQIDDELAEAHTSLGYIKKEFDWDFQGAETELKRAIQLNANYPTAHFWYALYLAETLGRYDEALTKMNRAQELEPLSLIMSTDRGMILYLAHRYDQAIEQFHKTLDMEPKFFRAHFWLGRAYEQKGMYKEAIEEFQKARDLDDKPFVLAALGHAFAASGRRGDAQKVLDDLSQLSKRMYVDSYNVAAIHAALGQTDQAFQFLEKAYEDRSTWLSRIKVDPIFDNLHSDPRFTNLVQRIGLP